MSQQSRPKRQAAVEAREKMSGILSMVRKIRPHAYSVEPEKRRKDVDPDEEKAVEQIEREESNPPHSDFVTDEEIVEEEGEVEEEEAEDEDDEESSDEEEMELEEDEEEGDDIDEEQDEAEEAEEQPKENLKESSPPPKYIAVVEEIKNANEQKVVLEKPQSPVQLQSSSESHTIGSASLKIGQAETPKDTTAPVNHEQKDPSPSSQ